MWQLLSFPLFFLTNSNLIIADQYRFELKYFEHDSSREPEKGIADYAAIPPNSTIRATLVVECERQTKNCSSEARVGNLTLGLVIQIKEERLDSLLAEITLTYQEGDPNAGAFMRLTNMVTIPIRSGKTMIFCDQENQQISGFALTFSKR